MSTLELDPLAKVLLILWSVLMFLIYNDILTVLVVFFVVTTVAIMIMGGKTILRLIYVLRYWLLIIFLLQFFIFKTLDLLFYLILFLKLLGYWIAFGLFFEGIEPGEIADTLQRIKMPFNLANSIAISIALVERYYYDLRKIKDILVLRGLILDPKKPFKSAKSLYNLLIPTFVLAHFRSKTISIALTTKNWGYTKNRTRYRDYRFNSKDWLLILVMIFVSIGRMFCVFHCFL